MDGVAGEADAYGSDAPATLFAGFGSMYFSVTSMTDADHRQQFFAPIIDEIERALTVHAVYAVVRETIPAPLPGRGGR